MLQTGTVVDPLAESTTHLNIIDHSDRQILVLIPAHNEAGSIRETIESVLNQSLLPTLIVVVADNCTDATAEIAEKAGAFVFTTNGNKDKKAGALNQALSDILELMSDQDAVLIMDADTTLSPTFLEVASKQLTGNVGGVGGAFIGRPSKSVIGWLQRMEFYRYLRQIKRYGNRAFVLSGTGTLFSVKALREVKAARNGITLPNGASYYDTASLTEDNEITLALLTLNWRCLSPPEMQTTTDVMETIRALWKQRERWSLGALWNLRNYGRKMPWHMRIIYWRQQAGLMAAVLTLLLFASLLTTGVIATGHLGITKMWFILGGLVVFERLVSIWKMGWKPRILVLTGVDQLYSILLCIIFLGALVMCALNKKGTWTPT